MLSRLRTLTKKQIALVVVAASMFGTVGYVGVSQAATPDKPTKAQCAQMGFPNYGQCVKVWAQGHGYGGFGYESTTETTVHKVERSWAYSIFHW
jgi:hypothetical protein